MAKNTKIINDKVNNKNYWQDRAINTFLEGEKDALKVSRHLKSLYQESIKEIDKKIYEFYGKYASDNELTLSEATQILDRSELKDFKSYINAMLKMGNKNNFSQEEMYEFKRLYNKAKITRLEELQANIRGELDKLAVKTINDTDNLLLDTYEDGYYKTIYNTEMEIGFSDSFSGLNKRAIEKAIKTKYSASNYSIKSASQGIWSSTDKLMQILTKEIPRGITLGYNPRKLTRDIISKRVDKTLYNNTLRLIRTEYSHILNQSILDGYKEMNITQYQIVTALDDRRCEDCAEFEGKIVNISDAIEGIDLPPFHPNCRCTTIPYFEEDYIDKMFNKELDKIGFVTYDDWKDGLVEYKDGEVQYNWDKGAKIKENNNYKEVSSELRDNLIKICNKAITTDKELAEIKYYTSNGYELFNQPISEIKDYDTKVRIANFEELLNKGTLQENSILYRGLEKLPKDLLKEFNNNEINIFSNYQNEPNANLNSILNKLVDKTYIDDETFVSTSIDRDIAINKFGIVGDNIGFVMEIDTPANTNGLYVEEISVNPDEKEFIINNDYKYKVKDWEIINVEKGKMIKFTVDCISRR